MDKNISNKEKNSLLYKLKPKNKFTIFIVYLLSLILISGLAFFIAYSFIVNKATGSYLKSTNSIITSINNINNTIGSIPTDKELTDDQVSKIEELASKNVEELSKVADTQKNLSAPDKYTDSHYYLSEGLLANTNMYNQILTIVPNLTHDNISEYLEQISFYASSMNADYTLSTFDNVKLNSSDNIMKVVDLYIKHYYDKLKLNREAESKKNAKSNFVETIDTEMLNFKQIFSDYKSNLENARKGSITFQSIVYEINLAKNKSNNIKKFLNSVTVPTNGEQLKNDFISILDKYTEYLSNYISELEKESSSSPKMTDDQVKENYKNSSDSFKQLQDSMNSFTTSFNTYKAN